MSLNPDGRDRRDRERRDDVPLSVQDAGAGGDIVVPGSVANLGGGFDTLGVAVQLYLRARMVDVRQDGGSRLVVTHSRPAITGRNALERAFAHLVEQTGRRTPTVFVEVESEIPIAAGLGSSAAATVAGLRVFERAGGPVGDATLLGAATWCEGHADNAAPALFGGLTSVMESAGRDPVALRWTWPDELCLVVGTPSVGLSTSKARAALPDTLPRRDAVFNLQRVLALVHALERREFGMLREAVQDRWHQAARAPLVPLLKEVLELDHPDVAGAFLSGAGPTIALLAYRNVGRVQQLLETTYERAGVAATVRTLQVHQPSEARAGAAASVQERSV